MRKPTICFDKNKDAFVFATQYNSSSSYTRNFKLLTCFFSSLFRTWLGTLIVGFLMHRLKYHLDPYHVEFSMAEDSARSKVESHTFYLLTLS